jgi:hypothetical protein
MVLSTNCVQTVCDQAADESAQAETAAAKNDKVDRIEGS